MFENSNTLPGPSRNSTFVESCLPFNYVLDKWDRLPPPMGRGFVRPIPRISVGTLKAWSQFPGNVVPYSRTIS